MQTIKIYFQVRSVSARALGAMVRGMGESSFEDLLPWLMQTLTSETSSVDRSGAAQGLSEVVGGLGVEKLHKLMPGIGLLVSSITELHEVVECIQHLCVCTCTGCFIILSCVNCSDYRWGWIDNWIYWVLIQLHTITVYPLQ
jgi:hypothetical protein